MAHGGSVRLRDLRPIRDYCYVGDLAKAVLYPSCLVAEKLEVFNIGIGKVTNVGDFATCALRSMGTNLPVVEDRLCARPRRSEIFELVADVFMARNALG
jgi:nucleoside-diphosphate-sugar epimerase